VKRREGSCGHATLQKQYANGGKHERCEHAKDGECDDYRENNTPHGAISLTEEISSLDSIAFLLIRKESSASTTPVVLLSVQVIRMRTQKCSLLGERTFTTYAFVEGVPPFSGNRVNEELRSNLACLFKIRKTGKSR
jgi:hypothetical protein